MAYLEYVMINSLETVFLLKSKAVILQRWQGMYSSIIDVGEKLRTDSDPETSAVLQEELSQLQQSWGDTQVQLEKMKTQLSSILQVDSALQMRSSICHQGLWEAKSIVL